MHDYSHVLPFVGYRVGRLWLDQGCALELHPPSVGDLLVVRLSSRDFLFVAPDEIEHMLTPHDHASLIPLFPLIGAHVAEARITREGDLHLVFDTGARLKAWGMADGWWWLDRDDVDED